LLNSIHLQDVVTVSADTIVDRKVFDTLLASGYSRFPVTASNKPNQVIGLLLIKKLLRYDPSTKQTVAQLPLSLLPEARPNINCFQALDYFQTGRSHLLLLTKNPGNPSDNFPAGVVTLEGKPVNLLMRGVSIDIHDCFAWRRRH
jgi:metal transporter CNNM